MTIIHCDFQQHGQIILDVFNEVILTSTALYEYEARTLNTIEKWFKSKEELDLPIFGAVDASNHLMGFGAFSPFRSQPATHLTLEHSLYIHRDFRGQKVGAFLLEKMIQFAQNRAYHTMIASIDSENVGCIVLHQKYGFFESGRIKEAALKFDRWLDLTFYQKIL